MRKIFYVLGLGTLMFGILTGCDSDAQHEKNSKDTKQTDTRTKEAEDVDHKLETLGHKSTDIHTYITDQRSEKEYYGRYDIECENPLILKVENKNDTTFAYTGRYSYYSLSGKAFPVDDEWYVISGFRDYKERLLLANEWSWGLPYEDDSINCVLWYDIWGTDGVTKGELTEESARDTIENMTDEEFDIEKWFKYETDGNICNVYMRANSNDEDEIQLDGYCIINKDYGVEFSTCIWAKKDAQKVRDEIENGKLLEEMFSVRRVGE